MLADNGQSFTELGLNSRGRIDHQRDDEGFNLLLFGVGNRGKDLGVTVGGRRRGPTGLEVILKSDSSGLADLVVDGGLGDEAEDGEAVVGFVGGIGESGLGTATGFGEWGESVKEAFR